MSIHTVASISHSAPTTTRIAGEVNSRKRKKDDADSFDIDRRRFTIRPSESEPFAKPRVFTPIRLLPRAVLPLSCLDISNGSNPLFTARIASLTALEGPEGEPVVLIAEDEREKRLYAVERAGTRTYALCRLATWVTDDVFDSRRSAEALCDPQSTKRRAVEASCRRQSLSRAAAVEQLGHVEAARHSGLPLPKLCLDQEERQGELDLMAEPPKEPIPAAATDRVEPASNVEAVEPAVSAQDTLQELAKQYLQALYLSRTSLAYFAKGPLSRARVTFSGPLESETHRTNLTMSLRETVLGAAVMDKKYRENISAHIDELPAQIPDAVEQSVKARKKRKWRSKRDRLGFFADERDYLERWWYVEEDGSAAPSSAETKAETLRRRTPRLRNRETYLQVILCLETLALEATLDPIEKKMSSVANLVTESQGLESQDRETQDQDKDTQGVAEVKKRKTKKPQDLSALLEVLLDRLCIWHSLEAHSPSKKGGIEGEAAREEPSDELRSFCVDVVIPFYMSRIPQQAALVNKKLGGPSAPTPAKRKPAPRKPGDPAVRQAPEKQSRNPLQRVSTDTLNQAQKPPPSFNRSATDSQLQQRTKRGSSEAAPLYTIPAAKAGPPQSRKRTSLIHSISFNKREVDLSAMTQATKAKMRKNAETEEKLREAIATLKKPNRPLATKDIAETADQGFAKAMERKRPGQPLRRERMAQSVCVAATPSHGRSVKGMLYQRAGEVGKADAWSSAVAESAVPLSAGRRSLAPLEEPPSSTFAIPQTGHRPRRVDVGVAAIPSHRAQVASLDASRRAGLLESPVAMRRTACLIAQTPSKPAFMDPEHLPETPALASKAKPLSTSSVASTSLRGASLEAVSPDPSGGLERGRDTTERPTTSIYQALGWDEEYEQLN